MKKNYMFTAGPTPLDYRVTAALAQPIIHHRTPRFQAILKEAIEGLRYIFQTKNDVFIFASSATGMMEAVVANLLSPKDKVLIISAGIWGEMWVEICNGYGIQCEIIKVEWGKPVEPALVKDKLKEGKGKIKAVFTTLCETSTGVISDIKAIGEIIKDTEAILVVDAASGLATVDLKTDAWACDIVLAGSQKGLMLAPGLGFVSVSKKAWSLVEESRCPKYYFDFKKAKKALRNTDTPFTPAISLITALNESIRLIKRAGLENIFSQNKKFGEAIRAAARALGLKVFASSHILTSIKVPEGIDAEKLITTIQGQYNIKVARGLGKLKGKIFRIGHIGNIDEFDIMIVIYSLEKVLYRMGYKFELGAGIRAVEEIFR